MKRRILAGLLAISIIGGSSFVIGANVDARKNTSVEFTDIYGDISSIGDAKIKGISDLGTFQKKVSTFTNTGKVSETIENRYEEQYLNDKRLFRDMLDNIWAEGEDIKVVFNWRYDKGLMVRCKNGDKYKEFNIIEDPIDRYDYCRPQGAFIKDGFAYLLCYTKVKQYYILKIDVKNEKIAQTTKIADEENLFMIDRRDCKFQCKNNMVYIPFTDADKNLKIFKYDLAKNEVTSKKIELNLTNLNNQHSNENKFFDGENVFLTTLGENQGKVQSINITSYNVMNEEKKNLSVDLSTIKNLDFKYCNLTYFRNINNKLYMVLPEVIECRRNIYNLVVLDKNTGKIQYIAKAQDKADTDFYLDIE